MYLNNIKKFAFAFLHNKNTFLGVLILSLGLIGMGDYLRSMRGGGAV